MLKSILKDTIGLAVIVTAMILFYHMIAGDLNLWELVKKP